MCPRGVSGINETRTQNYPTAAPTNRPTPGTAASLFCAFTVTLICIDLLGGVFGRRHSDHHPCRQQIMFQVEYGYKAGYTMAKKRPNKGHFELPS
jgi:hypothetical protein